MFKVFICSQLSFIYVEFTSHAWNVFRLLWYCVCGHQTNNFHVLSLLTFYRLYFVIQQRSREHFSLLIFY